MTKAIEPSLGKSTKKRQVIQSVVRASRILLTVAESQNGLTASELSSKLDLALPTAYHLLATLEEEKLLHKEPGKRYMLGQSAVDLANSPNLRVRVDARHRHALRKLAETTQETAYLTGWFRGEIRILDMLEGSQAVRVAGLEVGLVDGIHARASAKVLLAYIDEEHRSQILDSHNYIQFTSLTVPDGVSLEAQLNEIRRDGIFYDPGEFQEGVRVLSAPIRKDGKVVAALAISAPASRYEETESFLVSTLLDVAEFAEQDQDASYQ